MNQNILDELASKLIDLAKTLNAFADISREASYSDIVEIKDTAETVTVTLEEVRGVLAEKSHEGKREEVKNLISKFGAEKLSDIDPSKYAELLSEAEVI